MLIVIVIIGILAAALVPKLTSFQARARDTKRRVDIKNIYTAVMEYYQDYGDHPMSYCNYVGCHVPGGNFGTMGQPKAYERSNGSGGILSSLVPTYLTAQPVDPINNDTYAYTYYYMGQVDVDFVKSVCTSAGAQSFNPKVISQMDYNPEFPTSSDELRGCPGNISRDQALVSFGGSSDPATWVHGVRLVNGETLGFKQN